MPPKKLQNKKSKKKEDEEYTPEIEIDEDVDKIVQTVKEWH